MKLRFSFAHRTGFLHSLTNTAKIDECPGVCVHALATLMCDDVLEEVQCPTASMRCCFYDAVNGTGSSSENAIDDEEPTSTVSTTTIKTTTISTTTPTTIATTLVSMSTSSTSAKTTPVRLANLALEKIN